MKIYLVGGAVRDELLGLPVKENDWVVVGSTVEDMIARGYKQVGKDFPVFLHPQTNEEYALARVERKIKPGYQGFSFNSSNSVTLEEDLSRRDLTINAMAKTEDGDIIDPYHGQDDLHHRLLKHVSPAFAEDPVRILRIGRFAARYHKLGFHVAPETNFLMEQMVDAGEVDALVPERVWKELERALGEQSPEQFFYVLNDCHALAKLFPHLTPTGDGIKALRMAAKVSQDPMIRFAALLHAYPETTEDPTQQLPDDERKKTINQLCRHYRVPNHFRELATLTALHAKTAFNAQNLTPHELLQLLSTLDIFRREERFHDFVIACHAIAKATGTDWDGNWLTAAMNEVKKVDVQALVEKSLNGNELAAELKESRLQQLQSWLK